MEELLKRLMGKCLGWHGVWAHFPMHRMIAFFPKLLRLSSSIQGSFAFCIGDTPYIP